VDPHLAPNNRIAAALETVSDDEPLKKGASRIFCLPEKGSSELPGCI
jgi:hypothetical protein